MTDPNERDRPTLGDELFGGVPAVDDPAGAEAVDHRAGARHPSDAGGIGGPSQRLSRPRPLASDRPGCRDIGGTIAGFVTFVFIDCVMMYAPFQADGSPTLLPQLLTLLLLAFGLGGMLVWHIRGGWRPFGIGLMLGWLFMTLVSAGYLTGLNS